MTRADIIRIAVEAGATYYADGDHLLTDDLDAFDFADRVAAATREECADAVRFADNGTEAAEIIRAGGNP